MRHHRRSVLALPLAITLSFLCPGAAMTEDAKARFGEK